MVRDPHQFTYILDEFGKKKQKQKPAPRVDFMNLFYPISERSIPGFFWDVAKVAIILKPI
jgi:hypothetical protein